MRGVLCAAVACLAALPVAAADAGRKARPASPVTARRAVGKNSRFLARRAAKDYVLVQLYIFREKMWKVELMNEMTKA